MQMSIKTRASVALDSNDLSPVVAQEISTPRRFFKSSLLFILFGILIYFALYAASEQLVYTYAKRNRFFQVKTAQYTDYDYVILGASHAAALDYEDMTPRLEQMTNSKIINLSEVGSGIFVNRLLLDYFLVSHHTRTIVYVADSFAFYSQQWNEDRLNDTRLFVRAPFDPALVQLLLASPAARSSLPDYILGFSKINNPDRFSPDINDDERTKFETTYRPVKQIDQQRLDYLYPKEIDDATFQHYLAEFEDLVRYLQANRIRLIVVKPPIPARFYQMLPNEAQFDERLQVVLNRYGVEFHDFSLVDNDEKFFFNSDHLNKTGVLNFFNRFSRVLAGSMTN
jgi:hypothetical protein